MQNLNTESRTGFVINSCADDWSRRKNEPDETVFARRDPQLSGLDLTLFALGDNGGCSVSSPSFQTSEAMLNADPESRNLRERSELESQ